MINIKPSDIKGPLSRYQATNLDKQDFLHLMQSINQCSENSIAENILSTTFEGLWPSIESDLKKVIRSSPNSAVISKKADEKSNAAAIEEILQLVRKQNSLLSSPEQLLPPGYIEYAIGKTPSNVFDLLDNLFSYLSYVYDRLQEAGSPSINYFAHELNIMDFIRSLRKYIPQSNRQLYDYYNSIRRKYLALLTVSDPNRNLPPMDE